MLDPKFLRDNADFVARGARRKHIACDVAAWVEADRQWRELTTAVETMRSERKGGSEKVRTLKGEEKERAVAEMKDLNARLKEAEERLEETRLSVEQLILVIPNPPLPEVPDGKSEEENVEIRRVGEIPTFDFEPLDHVELGKRLNIIDIERGVRISGSRFYFLRGAGARLEMAILKFALDHMARKGFEPMVVPMLVKDEAMEGTGYFPTGREQAYYVEKDQLALVGTAEVSLTSYHRDEILEFSSLPVKLAGISGCFRREAGTYGKDAHGLYRIHQFQKVEQVVLCGADESESEKWHQTLVRNAEEVLQALELPYRLVNVCAGDLGMGQVKKTDIEVWMPGRKSYGETHSCSTFHEYQARRLKIRYKDAGGRRNFVHTLNNTVIASPRILIPLLEIHQRCDGTVKIPGALVSYMDGQEIIEPPKGS